MEHLNVFIFVVIAQTLEHCRVHARANIQAAVYSGSVDLVKSGLELLLKGDGRYTLKESHHAASSLLAVVTEIQSVATASPSEPISAELSARFLGLATTFDNALNLELGRAPIFWVKPKGVFDTTALITRASMAFTDLVVSRLPKEAVDDTDQAGRCIAFSLGTAAGFHIARATEAVMKRYMTAYACPELTDKQRNWGQYIRALREKGAHAKVLAHLEQIKDLHRNPLIHPEVHLMLAEAVTLFAICTSAIHAMVADMETKSPQPDPAIVAMLPKDEAV